LIGRLSGSLSVGIMKAIVGVLFSPQLGAFIFAGWIAYMMVSEAYQVAQYADFNVNALAPILWNIMKSKNSENFNWRYAKDSQFRPSIRRSQIFQDYILRVGGRSTRCCGRELVLRGKSGSRHCCDHRIVCGPWRRSLVWPGPRFTTKRIKVQIEQLGQGRVWLAA